MPVPDDERLFDLAPAPLVLLSRDLVVVRANRDWLAAARTTPEAAAGRRLTEFLPAELVRSDDPDGIEASLQRVRDTGRPVPVTVRAYDARGGDGSLVRHWWAFRTVPVRGDDGEPAFLLHRGENLPEPDARADPRSSSAARPHRSERMRQVESALHARTNELVRANAELRALGERERRSARLLTGLATTISALAAAESRPELLRQLFRHGRAAFEADGLAVALFDAGGGRLTVVDARSGVGPWPVRPLPLDSPLPGAAAAAGRPVYQSDSAESGRSLPPWPGLRAWAALPLHSGPRPLGSVTIGWRRPHPFPDDDVRLLEAFAAQCAQALDRVARLEAERRRAAATRSLAEVLQRSLLTAPPQPAHLEIAVRYRPAAREAQIGGDWYDAFLSPAGALTVAVGDVTGHDRAAAALAGQLRNMLRGIVCALEGHDPATVLGTLDRALRQTGVATLATALVAHVEEADPAGGRPRTFRWSSAGHPPPLLIEANGVATLLERPSEVLLGVSPDVARTHHSVPLSSGATVVLYTDGLVERRDATLDDGLGRLLAAAPELARRPVEDLCDELLVRLDPELTDDIALLALRVRGDRS